MTSAAQPHRVCDVQKLLVPGRQGVAESPPLACSARTSPRSNEAPIAHCRDRRQPNRRGPAHHVWSVSIRRGELIISGPTKSRFVMQGPHHSQHLLHAYLGHDNIERVRWRRENPSERIRSTAKAVPLGRLWCAKGRRGWQVKRCRGMGCGPTVKAPPGCRSLTLG